MENFGFKFEIGQVVQLKVQVELGQRLSTALAGKEKSLASLEKPPIPQTILITERLLQQCPGGVQRHYLGRPTGLATDYGNRMATMRENFQFNEIELEPVPSA